MQIKNESGSRKGYPLQVNLLHVRAEAVGGEGAFHEGLAVLEGGAGHPVHLLVCQDAVPMKR